MVKNSPANAAVLRDVGSIPGSERSPGGEMAAHPSILAWRIPWTESWRATAHGVAESETTEATYVYGTFPHSTSVKILLILKEVSLK